MAIQYSFSAKVRDFVTQCVMEHPQEHFSDEAGTRRGVRKPGVRSLNRRALRWSEGTSSAPYDAWRPSLGRLAVHQNENWHAARNVARGPDTRRGCLQLQLRAYMRLLSRSRERPQARPLYCCIAKCHYSPPVNALKRLNVALLVATLPQEDRTPNSTTKLR